MELATCKILYFSLVESSEDYINDDDDEPAPFVIMPPPSNNTEVNTTRHVNTCTVLHVHVLLTVISCFVDLTKYLLVLLIVCYYEHSVSQSQPSVLHLK